MVVSADLHSDSGDTQSVPVMSSVVIQVPAQANVSDVALTDEHGAGGNMSLLISQAVAGSNHSSGHGYNVTDMNPGAGVLDMSDQGRDTGATLGSGEMGPGQPNVSGLDLGLTPNISTPARYAQTEYSTIKPVELSTLQPMSPVGKIEKGKFILDIMKKYFLYS